MARAKVLAVCLTAAIVLAAGCDSARKQQEQAQALQDAGATLRESNAALKLEAARLEYQNVESEFGGDVARKWDRCVNDPPKMKANQESCARLVEHVRKAQAARSAADQAAAAKW
jgi:hypothetical protein